MDDDLGTPAAVAVLYQAVRDGNTALAAGDKETAAARLAEVLGMLAVLGLDAADPIWQRGGDDATARGVVDGLVARCWSSGRPPGSGATSPRRTRSATP